LDQIDLAIEPGNARDDFVESGFAITHRITGRVRPAFQNAGNKNRLPSQAHGDEDFRQQFTRWTDKRMATEIFLDSRCLTDKQDSGMTVTGAKNHRMTGSRQVGTA
jgi:hypothetical protein